MQTDSKKLESQLSFLKRWKANGAKGSLVAVTGYGKTTVGVLAIQDMNHHHPERETHVIVPTIVLKKQWEDHIREWNLKNVEVFVINTYIRKNHHAHLLVLDELHRYGSRTFSRVFSTAQFHFILGLTATIERQDGNHQLIERYAPVLRTIGLNEALQQGYVSDFIVFNLGVDLTTTEMKEYNEITRMFNHHFSKFGNDFNKVMNALKSRPFREYLSSILGKSVQEIHADAARFIQIMHRRKTFLNTLPSKLDTVREIFDQIDRKMIVFSETTEFADKVVEAIGPESFAYHTGIKNKKEMKTHLKQFKSNREFRLLSAVRSLEEGLDIPDLEVAILVSGNSTKRQYIQRIGRSLRAKPGKIAIIINILSMKQKTKIGSGRDSSPMKSMSSGLTVSLKSGIMSTRSFMNILSKENVISINTTPSIIQELILIRFKARVSESDILIIKEEQYWEYLIKEEERRENERMHSGVSRYAVEV